MLSNLPLLQMTSVGPLSSCGPRIAYIPDPSLAPLFDSFASAIVIGGDVSVSYSSEDPPTSASIKFNFKVVDGEGQNFEVLVEISDPSSELFTFHYKLLIIEKSNNSITLMVD